MPEVNSCNLWMGKPIDKNMTKEELLLIINYLIEDSKSKSLMEKETIGFIKIV